MNLSAVIERPLENDYQSIRKAQMKLNIILNDWIKEGRKGLCPIPNEQFHDIRPSPNARGLTAVTRYGINKFSQLFSARQLIALYTFINIINKIPGNLFFSLALSRVTDYCSTQSRWDITQERNVNSFGRQALPMLWDFAELVPFERTVGSWNSMLEGIVKFVQKSMVINKIATVENNDATQHTLPDQTASIWFTDPPYYDSVPYADLSDYFYVWLKRSLFDKSILYNKFELNSSLTPKLRECVWNKAYKINGKEKDPLFFEQTITAAFTEARRLDTFQMGYYSLMAYRN